MNFTMLVEKLSDITQGMSEHEFVNLHEPPEVLKASLLELNQFSTPME